MDLSSEDSETHSSSTGHHSQLTPMTTGQKKLAVTLWEKSHGRESFWKYVIMKKMKDPNFYKLVIVSSLCNCENSKIREPGENQVSPHYHAYVETFGPTTIEEAVGNFIKHKHWARFLEI